ncbi:AUXIN RESPONSE 4 protein [Nymphaea thermarum]|nr:AUXIN RESPONSE 4 protein [Nymphaea thermarum]
MVEIQEETALLEEKEPTNEELDKTTSNRRTSNGGNKGSGSPTIFAFWAYLIVFVSLLALVLVSVSSLQQPPLDDKSWFLSLTPSLHSHFSRGKTIKVYVGPDNEQAVELFVVEQGPREGETVLLVHGTGCDSFSFRRVLESLASRGIRAVGIDLPGSGFSGKSFRETVEDQWPRMLDSFRDVYDEIKEKGLFWGFDQLVETGNLPYHEKKTRVRFSEELRPIGLDSVRVGGVIEQIIDSMDLSPVHLVLHDSAVTAISGLMRSVASGSIRSVTIVDAVTDPKKSAFPFWVLDVVGVREVLLASKWIYTALLRHCCSKSMSWSTGNDHRLLLKARGGAKAVAEMGRRINTSFDLAEWVNSPVMSGVPARILWSSTWSEDWTKEGRRVAAAFPHAGFVAHSGGRWPQEDEADSVAEAIAQFVLSLPKSVRRIEETELDSNRKMMKKSNIHFHDGHENDHDHDHYHHGHETSYPNDYGLGHERWS